MSSIDNRIVQMQFDNSQFEKETEKSMKTIEKLKSKLNFGEAEQSLDELQKAGDSFSLAKMSKGVDQLTERFSTMGIIGMRVIQNLTDKVMAMGTSFVKSVSIDQLTAGFGKYAEKTKAVQQIVNATGLDIASVNQQLEKLNWFTDETSYSFTDMVSNIGKFTSMNIPLDKSVTAMQGISTWAALSGAGVQEASRAMYNLSQAIGLGSVKMQDWKSIALANMATAEFKQTAIDTAVAMGKLKQGAVTLNTFESTLSKGWFTSDVLMSVLEKYGDVANEVYQISEEKGISAAQAMELMGDKMDSLGGRAFKAAQEAKTFQEAIDATKDAVSSNWMNIFENIFGNYEEAKVLWTDLANWLWDVFASPLSDLNDVFTEWKNDGGRDDLLKGLYDSFHALNGIIMAVKDAFHDIFPPVTADNLKSISTAVKNFGEDLKYTLYYCDKLVGFSEEEITIDTSGVKDFFGELKRGSKGEEVKELQQKLIDLGYDLGKAGADGIFGPQTEEALKKFQRAVGETQDGVYSKSIHERLFGAKAASKINKAAEYVTHFGTALVTIKNIVRGAAAGFDILLRVFGFLAKAAGKVLGVLSPIGNVLAKLTEAAAQFVTALDTRIKNSTKFQEWLEKLDKLLEPVRAKIQSFCDTFLEFIGLSGNVDDIDFDVVINNLIEKFKQLFGITIDPSKIGENIDAKSIAERIKTKVIEIYNDVKTWITNLFSKGEGTGEEGIKIPSFDGYNLAIVAITALMGIFAGRVIQALGNFISITGTIKKFIKNINGTIAAFKHKQQANNLNLIADAIIKFAAAVALLAGAVWLLSTMSWENLAKGLVGITVVVGLIIGAVAALSAITKKFRNIESVTKSLLMFAGAVAALAIVVTMLAQLSWEQMGRGLLGVTALILLAGIALFGLKKLKVDKAQADSVLKIVVSLAAALGSFANVVAKLGALSIGTLAKGLIGLAAIMTMISVFMKSFNKLNVSLSIADALTIISLALAIDAIIAGFLVMAFAMKALKTSDIVKAIVGITVIVLALSGLMKIVSKMKVDGNTIKALVALLPMALAIDLVVAGFIVLALAFKMLRPSDIVKAVASITVIILALIAMMKAVGKLEINSNAILTILALLPIAMAIDLVVAGFVVLAMAMKALTVTDLVKAFASIVVIVLAMKAMMKKLSKLEKGISIRSILALVPMAIAFDLLCAGFIALALTMKKVNGKTLAKAIISMISVIVGMTLMAKALSKATPGLLGSISMLVAAIAMVGAMVAFALVLNHIKDVDTGKIVAFALGLSAIMIAFAAVSVVASVVGPAGILGAAAMVIAIGAAIGVLIAAFTAILNIPGVEEFLASGAEKLGNIVGSFTGAMKAADLKAFSKGMQGFKDVDEVDEAAVENTTKAAKIFAEFADSLPDASFGQKLMDFFLGSKMQNFSWDMVSFAFGFNVFAQEIQAVDPIGNDIETKAEYAIRIAGIIRDFSASLPEETGLEAVLGFLGSTKLSRFGSGMFKFASGFNKFGQEIQNVRPEEMRQEQIDFVINISEALVRLNDQLPKETGMDAVLGFLGSTKLSRFGRGISKFGTAFNNFGQEMRNVHPEDISPEQVDFMVNVSEALVRLNDQLPKETGMDAVLAFFGSSKLSRFGSGMFKFASGFNKFAQEMRNVHPEEISPEQIDFVINTSDALVRLNDQLPKETGMDAVLAFFGSSKLSRFGSGMFKFASGFNKFAQEIRNLHPEETSPEQIDFVINLSDYLVRLNERLPKETGMDAVLAFFGSSKLSRFGSGIFSFANGFNKFAQEIRNVHPADINVEQVDFVINTSEALVRLNDQLPKETGMDAVLAFFGSSKLSRFGSGMFKFASGFNKFAQEICNVHPEEMRQEQIDFVINISEALVRLNDQLPKETGMDAVLAFFGSSKLSRFSTGMIKFASGFNKFGQEMLKIDPVTLDEGKVSAAISIATAIRDFSNSLPEKNFGDVALEFLSGSAMENFNSDSLNFASGFNAFALEMAKINYTGELETNVKNALSIAEQIATFLSDLNNDSKYNIEANKGALEKWVVGDTVQNTLMDNMKTMASSMNEISGQVKGMSSQDSTFADDMKKVREVLTEYASFLSWLANGGDNGDLYIPDPKSQEGIDSKTHNFQSMLSSIQEIVSMVDSIGSQIKVSSSGAQFISDVSALMKSLTQPLETGEVSEDSLFSQLKTNIEELQQILSGEGEYAITTDNFLGGISAEDIASKLTKFTEDLGSSISTNNGAIGEYTQSFNTAGQDLATSFSSGMSTVDTSGIGTAVSSAVEEISGSEYSSKFSEAGSALIKALGTGMKSTKADVSGASDAARRARDSANSYKGDFVTVGKNFVLGLAEGMRNNATLASAVAAAVAREMLAEAKKALGITSPSKEGALIGAYFVQGIANGTKKETSMASDATENVAKSMLSTAENSLISLSSLLAEDIDDTPVISPVVDLTNARNAASSIGSMFGDQSFAVSSRKLASSASSSYLNRVTSKNADVKTAGTSIDNSSTGNVTFTNNTFSIRNDQDIYSLANEIATIATAQNRAFGASKR